jgi:hypothetical protein
MGANWPCLISLRAVDVILPQAHQLLNWSAFMQVLGDFGLDPRVAGASVAELPSARGAGKTRLKCWSLNKL